MNIDLGIVSVLLAVATFFIGRFASAKQRGQDDGELKSDIKHIKTSVEKQDKKLDLIVENYEDVKIEIERLKGRLKALEEKVSYMHPEGGQS